MSNIEDIMAARVAELEAALTTARQSITKMRTALFRRPWWRCVACGYFARHSGNHPCKNCGRWHYWTGSFVWPEDSDFCRQWIAGEEASLDKVYGPVPAAEPKPQEVAT